MTGERVSPRDVIADAILNSRYAPMRDSASRVADEVITLLEGSGWRIVPADEDDRVRDARSDEVIDMGAGLMSEPFGPQPARSPQDEDHEVLIATLRRRSTEPGMGWLNLAADALSSRNGSVAVEDVAEWLKRRFMGPPPRT